MSTLRKVTIHRETHDPNKPYKTQETYVSIKDVWISDDGKRLMLERANGERIEFQRNQIAGHTQEPME